MDHVTREGTSWTKMEVKMATNMVMRNHVSRTSGIMGHVMGKGLLINMMAKMDTNMVARVWVLAS